MNQNINFDQYRRRDKRNEYVAEVYFSVKKKAFTATIKNISRGGALISTGGMPKINVGEKIIITIPFTDNTKHVKRNALVMWVDKKMMGVQFI